MEGSTLNACTRNERARTVRQLRSRQNIIGEIMTTVEAATKSATNEDPITNVNTLTKPAQIRLTRRSPAYWRVTIDNPPINVMGPEMVREFQGVIGALEADEHVRVVVFDSAIDDYFLNHSDFTARVEDLTSMPSGPTGLPPGPDFL